MLTKVIFEYSDGRRKYLEGEELVKWDSFNSQIAFYAQNRGMNPPWETIKWKEEGITINEQKNTQEDKKEESTSKED